MQRYALLRSLATFIKTTKSVDKVRNYDRFYRTSQRFSTSLKYGFYFVTGTVVGALGSIVSYYCLYGDENSKYRIDNSDVVQMCTLNGDNNSKMIKLGSFEGDQASGSAEGVVNITVTSEGPPSPWLGPIGPREVQQSSGSGFIIDPQGFILTNAHVVSEASHYTGQVTVTLQDGRAFPGKLHSHDTLSDLAIIKIDAGQPLPCAKLGKSRNLRPGEWVIALGSPLMLANSVTSGIVSAVQRESYELGFPGSSKLAFIQTDAAINVGNSGGPLVNLDGEVVGINTMKALRSDGISFALPIDLVKEVVEQLKLHGFVKRPYLGIKLLTLSPRVLEELKERDPHFPNGVNYGVLVPQVLPGSPADRGGLRAGDVIVEFDGKPVKSTREFLDILGYRVDKPIQVKIIRGERSETISPPCALIVAGSDSCAGAVTAVTAQNTLGVQGIYPIEPWFVRQQLESILSDIPITAVKTGMLYSADTIQELVLALKQYSFGQLVVDPVLVAKGGQYLLTEDALETLKKDLFPLATLITPNIPEVCALIGREVESLQDVREAAKELLGFGAKAVLIKGGHNIASSELDDSCIDILLDSQGFEVYARPRLHTLNTHGTGCTTASAICAYLAKGFALRDAVANAKEYVFGCMEHSYRIGSGHGPLNHGFHITCRSDSKV
ncbi:Putative protease Do-like 14 [Galdieria sulphuraria]|nr:Putative protease Do-like 14 [Galdieria sulphuraria]